MILIVMGVTGAGKTTVGQALAQQLGWKFADADDYHSVANVAKMRAGIALTDPDRAPWLAALHNAIAAWLVHRDNVVLACSALKRSYREILLVGAEVKLVFLRVDRKLVVERLAARQHHYMNPSLIESQFATLEAPDGAVIVDAHRPVEEQVTDIRRALQI